MKSTRRTTTENAETTEKKEESRRIDEKSGKPFKLDRGESLSTRVGLLIHRSDATGGKVQQRYERYNAGKL